ncbi:MAG: 16S rRNA (uracil(1498)-N(3))-methyltransferase [Propionibacteriaceae bacterium]|jgi:16S rRNA (uracil1498-N3)-methyltransferase|nr:16S rRNA (uracil(1498)-N(3))-methyltransferase [Propionibacteriaceae bacterium]
MSDGFFLAPVEALAAAEETVTLTGAEAHHAAVVRRIRPGEIVTVADGIGHGVRGPVVQAERDQVVVTVAEKLTEPPSQPPITLVQALPKKDRADLAVDLMTEVGVDQIVPWQAARSIVRWTGERGDKALAKWRATAREAAKHSRRLTLPTVTPLATTAQVAELLREAANPIVMHETATAPISQAVVDPTAPVVCVIGPEGGIAPDELALFQSAGAATYLMGPTVLRTSTAGAVAITQLRLLAAMRAGGAA